MNPRALLKWVWQIFKGRNWIVFELSNHSCKESYLGVSGLFPANLKSRINRKRYAFKRWDFEHDEIEACILQSGLTKKEAKHLHESLTAHQERRPAKSVFRISAAEITLLAITVPLAAFIITECPDWFHSTRNFFVPFIAETSMEEAPPDAFFLANLLTFFLFALGPFCLLLHMFSLTVGRGGIQIESIEAPPSIQPSIEPLPPARNIIAEDPNRWTKILERCRPCVIDLRKPNGGGGSGILVSANGLILTNSHVATPGIALKVSFHNAKTCNAVCIHRHPKLDLSVIKAASETSAFLDLEPGISRDCKDGDEVLAIGSPRGLPFTSTRGIISQRERQIEDALFVQTDIATNPGNSGGPLLDAEGKLVGLITLGLWTETKGIGFAIPARQVFEYWTEVSELIRSRQLTVPSNTEIDQLRRASTVGPRPIGCRSATPECISEVPAPSIWIPSVS